MLKKTTLTGVLASLATIVLGASSALAQPAATATMTAAPNGPNNFLYTINLHNAGTTPIETFWFAWIPGYDFLQTTPTPTGTPANWSSFVETGFYGKSIEFYDPGLSSPINPGQSSNAFQFTSSDSPSILQGNGPLGLPYTYSYVYSGVGTGPGVDPVSASNIINNIQITTVPEPTAFVLAGIGGAMCLLARRRRATK